MHVLSCITDGLVIAPHNKIRDEILYLSQHAFTSESVCAEPRIHQGCTRSEQEIRQGSDKDKEIRGDAMVQGLWDRQVDAIIYVKIGEADADSYKYEPTAALLARWEMIKKYKHNKHCHDQRKIFAVCSLSGHNAREGSPGRTIAIESINGREKGITPFASTGVGKWSNCNCRCEVLFTNDPQSSAPQYPKGTRAGLGSGTRNRVGR